MVGPKPGVRQHTLGHQGHEIECGIEVHTKVIRIALLGSDDVGPLGWIANEEDRKIDRENIVIAFVGIKSHGDAAWIPSGIGKLSAVGCGGEAN